MDIPSELLTAIDVANAGIEVTYQDFRAASKTYEEQGTSLEAQLAKQMSRMFLNPENDRAPEIQAAANAVTQAASSFGHVRTTILSNVGLLRMALNQALAGQVVQALGDAIGAAGATVASTNPDPTARVLEEVKALFERLNAAQARQLVLLAQSVAIRRMTAQAQQLATAAIGVRLDLLGGYLGEVRTAVVQAQVNAIGEVAGAEVTERLIEAVFKVAAKSAGIAVETLIPVGKLLTAAYELQKSLRGISEKHRRGEVDELFDLARHLAGSAAVAEQIAAHVGSVTDAILAARSKA